MTFFQFFLILAVVTSISYGLRCYECISEKDGYEDSPPYHKDCKEGGLPDSVAVNCSWYNVRNPVTMKLLTLEEINLKSRQNPDNITWMCAKLQGKLDGKEITVKACDEHAYGDEPRDEVDRCGSEAIGDDGSQVTVCNCFKDLCNGAKMDAGSILSIFMSVLGLFYYDF